MLLQERKPNRLKNFDYSAAGYYSVTICTKNRIECFGNIKNRQMVFNEYGRIVNDIWLKIPIHYKNIILDEFIVMPNHVHGIVVITNNSFVNTNVGNRHACSLQRKIKIRRQNQLLPIIVGSFKSASSKFIRQSGLNLFQWQKSFYDHIIRNEQSLFAIRQYIRNNSLKWNEDRNNPKNLIRPDFR